MYQIPNVMANAKNKGQAVSAKTNKDKAVKVPQKEEPYDASYKGKKEDSSC